MNPPLCFGFPGQPCLKGRQWSKMPTCRRTCSRTPWSVPRRPWRSTTSRKISLHTSKRWRTQHLPFSPKWVHTECNFNLLVCAQKPVSVKLIASAEMWLQPVMYSYFALADQPSCASSCYTPSLVFPIVSTLPEETCSSWTNCPAEATCPHFFFVLGGIPAQFWEGHTSSHGMQLSWKVLKTWV